MEQRINVVTLGVADVLRARAFYETLGWTLGFTDGDIVMFQAGGNIVSLWGRETLSADSGVADSSGWGGVTLGHFADPDGHTWEIAYIEAVSVQDDGTVRMPS
jgi:catechol 2,3-dioxygenase-like lactoylglutathione lyase family enzyme